MTILKKIKWVALTAMLAFGLAIGQRVSAQPGESVPVESFYDELAPYGQWMQYPGYGNAWQPNAGPDFQPYATGGHWVMTEYGNTWVSDYNWGWAPFHYGRWIYDPAYGGWLWLPGSDWAPAWVSWRSGGGYYGWAPLGPGVNVNVNINIPAPYWTFVPQVYFNQRNWYNYCVPRPRVVNIYQNTTIINNYYRTNNRAYAYGPPRGDIERYTRQPVQVYRIDQMDRPGRSVVSNGSVGFYRPGRASGYGQTYGRNDRFDNSPRPNYGNNSPSARGNYDENNRPNRDYNGGNTPNRTYDGNMNMPGRGSYGGNAPTDRADNYGTTPVPASPQRNRFESSRGSYSPGGSQPGGYSRGDGQSGGYQPQLQPSRSYERVERSGSMNNSQSMPGGRSGNGQLSVPEGTRGMQNRPSTQEQPQRSMGGFGGGERQGRGPR